MFIRLTNLACPGASLIMRRWTRFVLLIAIAITLILQTTAHTLAQAPQPSASTTDALSLIPPDAIALLTIQPRMLLQDDAMKLMPLEIMTASSIEQFGIDPQKIERVDVIVGLPAPTGLQF